MGEIEETQVTSTILPAIFLAVTAFLLHLVLSRLVGTQRDQIATLKAFGYGNVAIGMHYFELALIPVIVGVVLGSALGLWLADQLSAVYARFFQFPSAVFVPDGSIVAIAAVAGVLAGVLGSMGSVARSGVAAHPPRPCSPRRRRAFVTGSSSASRRSARPSPRRRIIGRNLERRPLRTLFSVAGLALAGGLVITVQSLYDELNSMKELQFHGADRADVTVLFRDARGASALPALGRLPGVIGVEGFRVVPVRLRAGGGMQRTELYGLAPDAELRRVVDLRGDVDRIPPDGLLLSATLARKLGVGRGDHVMVEVLEGTRPTRSVVVAGTSEEVLGTAAYMALDALRAIEGGDRAYSGAFLRTDARVADRLYRRAQAAAGGDRRGRARCRHPRLRRHDPPELRDLARRDAGVRLRDRLRHRVQQRARRAVGAWPGAGEPARPGLHAAGSGVDAAGRTGRPDRRVPAVRLPDGLGLSELIGAAFESDLYRIPVVVNPVTYALGAGVVTVAAVLSGLVVRRRIDRLDLVAVLKTRE